MGTHRFRVSAAEAGQAVAAVLRRRLALSWSAARRLVHEQRVQVAGVPCRDAARRVKAGQRIEVQEAPVREAGTSKPQTVIRYCDAQVVVVEKPSGLTTIRHPEEAAEFGARGKRFLPATLADMLPALLARGDDRATPRTPVRAVHRLDKDTSGLVVFARTAAAERHLGKQFRAHSVERCYLAVVRGRAIAGRIESFLARDRGDGRRGSSTQPGAGKRAVTHVRVLEEMDGYTLVECRLETGRTHQVRIHLGEQGTPLCGERIYDRPVHGRPLPDGSGAPRLALHAASLGFDHPATGKRMTWTSPLPEDLAALVARLRE
jgi:23S rRNA pseudouridine1911/1915/1917 synthase